MKSISDSHPLLIAHVIYYMSVGGLENGLINLVNRLPTAKYRHLIIALTEYNEFSQRIQRDDVEIIALHKRPGHSWKMFIDLFRLFKRYKPDIVHSRNLAALEAQIPAWLAGVTYRVHGEHGRDYSDMDGTNWRYILQRRLIRPFVHQYIALSFELERYLREKIGVPSEKVTRIINGVDIERFHRREGPCREGLPAGFARGSDFVVGTVGRLAPIKDQSTLLQAFLELVRRFPAHAANLRLVIVGDGLNRKMLEAKASESGIGEQIWFSGSREDVPHLLAAMDVFVLPSLAEGISNTIMEAMASGLPVIATDVGGNAELVAEGQTGYLVPRSDPFAMATAMSNYLNHSKRMEKHGAASRARAEQDFSLAVMVDNYSRVYQKARVRQGTA